MTVEYLRYTVPAEHQAAFIRDYTAAKVPLLQSPYATAFEMCQCVEDPSQFILRIGWTSASDHLQKFRASAEFREFFALIRPYLGMMIEMRHYEPR